jgi:cyanophycinase
MGVEHFSKLGADAEALPIIDRASADDPQYEATLEAANLIYFSGGNPIYLFETMNGSRAWAAAQKAWSRGAVYAGCSAGAMILAKRLPNFRNMGIGAANGFGVIPADFVMPHFDHAGPFKALVSLLQTQMKDGQRMIGIDENTALIGKLGGEWNAMGASNVYVMTRKQTRKYASGEVVSLV